MSNKKGESPGPLEITQFKIVEREFEVEVPKYVERVIEVPVYEEKIYELPVIVEKEYEKPIVIEKDLTEGLRQLIRDEIQKGIAEVLHGLKISMEIPVSRILQVRPRGE